MTTLLALGFVAGFALLICSVTVAVEWMTEIIPVIVEAAVYLGRAIVLAVISGLAWIEDWISDFLTAVHRFKQYRRQKKYKRKARCKR